MNILEVVPGKLYRGPEPQTDADRAELVALGITRVIDLETGSHWLFPDGDPLLEQVKMAAEGIEVFRHPLGTFFPPSPGELGSAVGFIAGAIVTTKIYVHCRQGVDRTGMVCCAYRVTEQGWSKEKAIAEMKSLGMHWWYYWWAWSL